MRSHRGRSRRGAGAATSAEQSTKWGRNAPRNGPAGRDMNLIASPSRSSGLEKDGDTLKDFKVQEDYREFIQGKLDNYLKDYPFEGDDSSKAIEEDRKREVQQNLLILFRKLREGISSSARKDDFALEVYETSLVLAILFSTPLQATTTLSYLLPGLYYTSSSETLKQSGRLLVTLISLLHHMVAAHPSQRTFHQHLSSIPPAFLPRGSDSYRWITSVASSIRTNNYARFEILTRSRPEDASTPSPEPETQSSVRQLDLGLADRAIVTLLDSLRVKARARTWLILRTAYRELWCEPGYDTSQWLERTLALRSVRHPGGDAADACAWLEDREKEGDARKKDGTDIGWVLVKPKQ